MDENLDYATSLDDTEKDQENLDANLDANLVAVENPDSLEGHQNSEMASEDAGMENNTSSFNLSTQKNKNHTWWILNQP